MGLANNNVTVTLANPAPGVCTPSNATALVALLNPLFNAEVTATGNTSFYNFGDTEPTAENRIYPWLKTISGYPDIWLVYVDGAWRPVNPQRIWYCGNTAGIVNAYTATTQQTYSSTTSLTVGDVFTANINITNTGATTLAVNGFTASAVTVGVTALVGGELIANGAYAFLWDGTRFRVLNPTVVPPAPATVAQFVYQEPSGTAAVVIAAGTTTIPINTIVTTQSWATLGGGGNVTITEGTYLITGTLAIADVGGTSGGYFQLSLKNSGSDLNWQDGNANNVDDCQTTTVQAVIVVAASSTAAITLSFLLSAAGSVLYAVDTTSSRAERPASLTILKLA